MSTLARPAIAAPDPGLRLRLAHGLPTSHPVHPAMQFMADLIRERSSGAVEITIFAGGELGLETTLVEQIRSGRLDMAKVSASVLERRVPAYQTFSLPFLLRSQTHWHSVVIGPVGDDILASGTESGIVGLTFYQAGSRSFYGARSFDHPDDLRGLKIRIQPSPTMSRMITLFSAQAVQLSWDVTYSALQTRLVDGAENSVVALLAGRHAEVVKAYAFDEHTMVPDVLVFSAQRWALLDEGRRRLIQEAARESFGRMNELWVAFESEARRYAERLGVVFTRPDKQPFVDRTAPLRREFAADDTVAALIARVDAIT